MVASLTWVIPMASAGASLHKQTPTIPVRPTLLMTLTAHAPFSPSGAWEGTANVKACAARAHKRWRATHTICCAGLEYVSLFVSWCYCLCAFDSSMCFDRLPWCCLYTNHGLEVFRDFAWWVTMCSEYVCYILHMFVVCVQRCPTFRCLCLDTFRQNNYAGKRGLQNGVRN